MSQVLNLDSSKVTASLSLNARLLELANKQKINLVATLEDALKEKLMVQHVEDSDAWRKENKETIASMNKFVEERGLFSDNHRVF